MCQYVHDLHFIQGFGNFFAHIAIRATFVNNRGYDNVSY